VLSLLQRYLIAAIAFAMAAVWLGVGLVKGLECLLAFLLASLIVAVVQRRQAVIGRRDTRRATISEAKIHRPQAADARERRRTTRSDPPPWPSRSLYDDEANSGNWSRPLEHHW